MRTKDEVETWLNEPLDKDVVETRKGGHGNKLEYVPGWYVIAKANQIFGVDGWKRETVKMDFYQVDGKVHAVAKSRVTVYFEDSPAIAREGTGGGTGWNEGDYEDAAKQAEKDALKRAFATFGQQFGLSLYQGGGETEIDLNGLSWYSPKQRKRLREAWVESEVDAQEAKEIFEAAEKEEWPLEEAIAEFE